MVVPSANGGPPSRPKSEGIKRQRHRPESSSLLDSWLQQHGNNLYPSKDEKEQLVKETELNYNQVSRWFANRRRKLKLRNCVSPSSSGGLERSSNSPTEVTDTDVPGISPQAPSCPGNAAVWNDGYNNTGEVNGNGVISTFDDLHKKLLDSNNNRESAVVMADNAKLDLPPPHYSIMSTPHSYSNTSTYNNPLLPPVSEPPMLGGGFNSQQLQQQQNLLKTQDLLPTPPAMISGIYPSVPGSNQNPFGTIPGLAQGLQHSMNMGLNGVGLFNPFLLPALGHGGAQFPTVESNNTWLGRSGSVTNSGFFPSLLSHPLWNNPVNTLISSDKQRMIEEEEAAVLEEKTKLESELKLSETPRHLKDLTEEESIAVSVLAEFASQRRADVLKVEV